MLHEKLDSINSSAAAQSLVFVGDHSAFSDLYLRLIQDEFPTLSVVNDTRLRDAEHRIAHLRDEAPMIVVSCKFGASVLPMIDRFAKMAPNARFVLAYDRLLDMRAVIANFEDFPRARRLSVLPMRSKIETSISVLHLLISGERHFSGELMDLALARCEELADTSGHNQATGCFADDTENPLTAREKDVMELLCHGAPNKRIASDLNLSESTVKLHIHKIIEKLGVHNRTEAAIYYLTSRVAGQDMNAT